MPDEFPVLSTDRNTSERKIRVSEFTILDKRSDFLCLSYACDKT